MPVYNFQCSKCKLKFRKMIKAEDVKQNPNPIILCQCGDIGIRTPKASTSQAMEVLDNGIGVRRIERLSEAERIFQDRAYANDNLLNPKQDVEYEDNDE